MTNFPAATPHRALEKLFEDVWRVHGSVDFKPMVRIGRNMLVVRNGEALTLINSVRLSSDEEKNLTELGEIKHVVKIGIHGMDDAYYVDKFGAQMWALAGAKLANGVTATDTIEAGQPVTMPDLSAFVFSDTKAPEAALLLQRHGGLLITCDSVQHWEPSELNSFMANVVTGVMGFKFPAQIGPPWRKKMTPDGGSLRPDFERLAALPFKHLISAHGGLLRNDGPAMLTSTIERVYG